jgi:PAS domain S-box-containing protein
MGATMHLKGSSLVKAMLDRTVILGIGLMIALLGIGAIGTYRSIRAVQRNAEWVSHTHEVEGDATDLSRYLSKAVNDLRGFFIDGEAADRDSVDNSLKLAQIELQELVEKTRDNSDQQTRLKAIHAHIQALSGEIERAAMEKAQGKTLTELSKTDRRLAELLQKTLSQVADFRSGETRLLIDREEEVLSALRTTLFSSVIVFGMGLALFTGIIELIRRNAATQQLQQNHLFAERRQLKVTLSNIDDAVVTVNQDGQISQWNLSAERLTGVTQADALGKQAQEVLHIVDELTSRPRPLEVADVLMTGQPVTAEAVCVVNGTNQRLSPATIRISAVQRTDNVTNGAVITIREVSELRQSELARTERARVLTIRADIGLIVSHSGNTFEQIESCAQLICERLAAAAVTIWSADAEKNSQTRMAGSCSPEWELLRSPLPETQQALVVELLGSQEHLRRLIETSEGELKWVGKDEAPNLHLWAIPLTIEDQKLGLLLVYTLKSLSDLTSSELSLVGTKLSQFILRRHVEAERQASEEMFRTLANSIPQLAWMARPDGYIFWYNQRWFDYTGTTLEQMQGWGWQSVHDPRELPHVLSSIRHSFETGEPWEDTFPLRRHDGEFRWHLSRMLPVKDEKGVVRLWFGTNTDVTEQRNAEQRLRLVIDSMYAFVGILSADGTLIEANQAPLIAADLTRDDVIGRKFWDCPWWNYRDDVRSRIIEAFQRATQGEWVRYDEEIRVKDDKRITIDFQLQPVFDEGRLLFVIPSGVDVTARRLAEERLAASKQFLSSVLNGLASHIAVLNETGEILMVNQAWKRFADDNGLTSSHYAVGQNYLDICTPSTADCPAEAITATAGIRSVLSGEQPWFQMEYPCHSPTEKRWFQMRVDRLCSPDSLRVVVSHENITSRVLSEEATHIWSHQHRQLAEIALQLSGSRGPEEILELVARGARNLIRSRASETVLWNQDGTIELIAEDWDTATDGSEGILASTIGIRDQIRETTAPVIQSSSTFSESGNGSMTLSGCLAVPLTSQDDLCVGAIRICEKHEGEYTADDEAILLQLAQMTSVSLERAKLNEEIRQSNQSKDQFLAMLAHELRNPLSAITSATQLLQLTPDDAAQVRSTSELALRQCHHLKQLVDDLLDVSRISRGKLNIQKKTILLQDVVEHAIQTSLPAIEGGKHTLTTDVTRQPIYVNGDSVRLAQAVSNLLVNAAKYTPAGGQISLRVAEIGSEVQIDVQDNGIGIPRQMIEQIFEIFTQVDASHSRSQGGLGIGLSLARTLIRLHGGFITAQSDGPDLGSVFTIVLPMVSGPSMDSLIAPSSQAMTSPTHRQILIVDDNRAAAHLLGRLLETLGHDVRTESDGQAALQALTQFDAEIVISDIGMPGMSGYELAQRILEFPLEDRKVPVLVALTGYGQAEDRQNAFAAGFRYHLTKPVSLADLQSLMQELSQA